MKLLISDTHLNITRRLEDAESALNSVFPLIKEYGVGEVWHLGDAYTSRRPHSKEREIFQRWVKKLTTPGMGYGCKLLVIKGNHDTYPDGTHSYSEFVQLETPGVRIVDNPFLEGGFFLGHFMLKESVVGTGASGFSDFTISRLLKDYPGCRSYFLGDVHKHQILHRDPDVVHVGSPFKVDFGEREDAKGVILLDESTGKWEFHRLPGRRMVQIDVDLSCPIQPISPSQVKEAIVKLVYHGTPEELLKVQEGRVVDAISRHCSEIYVAYNVVKSELPQVVVSEDQSAKEALIAFLNTKNYGEDLRNKLLELGEYVINSVDSK